MTALCEGLEEDEEETLFDHLTLGPCSYNFMIEQTFCNIVEQSHGCMPSSCDSHLEILYLRLVISTSGACIFKEITYRTKRIASIITCIIYVCTMRIVILIC